MKDMEPRGQGLDGWGQERRRLLGNMARGVGALYAAEVLAACDRVTGRPNYEQLAKKDPFHYPFSGPKANEVAERLGITAGNIWMTDGESLSRISKSSISPGGYLTQESLLPIFPPAVMRHEKVLKKVAKEMGLPVNVLATIESIESAGDEKAKSDYADGPAQVVTYLHFDKIVAIADKVGYKIPNSKAMLAEWERLVDLVAQGKKSYEDLKFVRTPEVVKAVQDPYIGFKVGAMVLSSDYQAAIDANPNLDPNHLAIWARALGSYNGGEGNASLPYERTTFESQMYEVHGVRMLITAEIAAQLRKKGLKDSEIARQLVSREIDARAWAFYQTSDHRVKYEDIDSYERLWRALAVNPIQAEGDPQLTREMNAAYRQHLSGDHTFNFPVSAGLRIWLVTGGDGIYLNPADNNDPKKYPANKK